ncbi:baseplate J/gp47 family protein [Motilimonas sp. 1_MG-2023]|uniref:baseplate assembly protein n=1 Tax=Motilimonas sp. 1_MG-2023 TaxID=3062672 RepID=UPI0026E36853|nr:baseplate J/gp47 family protein [Motilimonas sp. 1_MG-2023]MDO6525437.1 baseplate J/gp47 family protein [Motilimonas sp. 1_MG-2023]
MSVIDITKLPAPTAIETLSFETIYAERKSYFISLHPANEQENIAKTLELESEPVVKLLQENAYRELMLRQLHNERARKLMLAYTFGEELDHIGVTYYLTPRLVLFEGDPNAEPPEPPIYERDEDYIRRILLAHDAWSTAGSREAYIYYALSSSPLVKDASATRLLPGLIQVYVLSREEGATASLDLIETVLNALTAEQVRPLNDTVQVAAAQLEGFQLDAELEIADGPDSNPVLEAALSAALEYITKQNRLGGRIIIDKLKATLYAPGVDYVRLNQPTQNIITDESAAPNCESVNVRRRDE